MSLFPLPEKPFRPYLKDWIPFYRNSLINLFTNSTMSLTRNWQPKLKFNSASRLIAVLGLEHVLSTAWPYQTTCYSLCGLTWNRAFEYNNEIAQAAPLRSFVYWIYRNSRSFTQYVIASHPLRVSPVWLCSIHCSSRVGFSILLPRFHRMRWITCS